MQVVLNHGDSRRKYKPTVVVVSVVWPLLLSTTELLHLLLPPFPLPPQNLEGAN